MAEYTPTTDEMRKAYIGEPESEYWDELVGAEFDRWLEAHDRDVKAEAWGEGFSAAEEDVDEHNRTSWSAPCIITNPYRDSEEGHS